MYLEKVVVLNRGGIVLWEWSSSKTALNGNPIDALIENVLLEGRAHEFEYRSCGYKLQWEQSNEEGLLAIGLYRDFTSLRCVGSLLSGVIAAFKQKYTANDIILGVESVGEGFDSDFDVLLRTYQKLEKETKPASVNTKKVKENADQSSGKAIKKKAAKPDEDLDEATRQQVAEYNRSRNAESGAQMNHPNEAALARLVENVKLQSIKVDDNGRAVKISEKDWSETKAPRRGRLAAWLRNRVSLGTRELDEDDMRQLLPPLRNQLISKNVAVEIAEKICSSVSVSLKGVRLAQLEKLSTVVEQAMIDCLHQLLRPKHEVDILRSVHNAKNRRKPYTIVVCGVNGVGKSTSLAKLTYWLKQNGHTVLLVAGDTFRSGAVEQLHVHARCLETPVFQKGYGVDPTIVVAEAIQIAGKEKYDVVLVDTAGRMQDHESRMRALANLIHDNTPDCVLFVGEALVGNQGVEQLRKFNQCLINYTPVGRSARGIDGIVLTKFDTIDDKVGAAVSMVQELGQPIVFVGVGQTYQDLKTITPEVVIDALMS